MAKMKRLMATMLAGAMVFGMTGCGGNSDNNSNAAGSGSEQKAGNNPYNVSVILKTTAAEYWQFVLKGAEAYAAEHDNVNVDVKGPTSETAFDEQLNMIETDLSNDTYDGYIISPLQSDMVATLIKGLTKPIIAVDTDIDAPEVLSFVGTGNESAAELGGKAAVEAAKAAGWKDIKCIEIAGVQGDQTNTARMNGYKKGVNEAGGEFLENEVQYADAVADKAVTCMEGIMQTHPEGIAIICANNDDMAMAAARAAKDNKAYENTIFLGFNGDKSACNAILEGKMSMSVAQMAYEMGYKSVESIVKALDGEKLDEFIDSGADVIDINNAQARLDDLDKQLGK